MCLCVYVCLMCVCLSVLSRLEAFLPAMANENKKLDEAVAAGQGAKHCIEADGSDDASKAKKPPVIEMVRTASVRWLHSYPLTTSCVASELRARHDGGRTELGRRLERLGCRGQEERHRAVGRTGSEQAVLLHGNQSPQQQAAAGDTGAQLEECANTNSGIETNCSKHRWPRSLSSGISL